MPNVSFRLRTFGLDLTRDIRANVIFTPSRRGAIGPDGILVSRVVVPFSEINPTTGVGVAVLAQTTLLRPETHFNVSIEWLDAAPSGWAEINWPIRVPATGGNLRDLMDIPAPSNAFAIARSDPGIRVGIGGAWIDDSVSPPILKTRAT